MNVKEVPGKLKALANDRGLPRLSGLEGLHVALRPDLDRCDGPPAGL